MNRKYLGALLLLVLFMLFGCATGKPVPPSKGLWSGQLVGHWFGIHQQEGIDGDIQEICHMKADGTFHVRFRLVKDGKPGLQQDEYGYWELKDHVKTMATAKIDDLDLPQHILDKYSITNVTETEMNYVDMKSGAKFKNNRVAEGFQFP